ncbi:MAG TPA: hypothetical protein VMV04_04490 [Thermodesulfobacteriota bacterium]|nr:hypothetical protein [Thermodesulfobacteriota bacterium]
MGVLIPEVQVLEKIVRPLVVYFFLLVAFRIAGKRELGQMTPFDQRMGCGIGND